MEDMFNRFLMGIKCAQDEFQTAMKENFGNIKYILSFCDDMIVYGFKEDGSDHDQALRHLLVIDKRRTRGLDLISFILNE